jgi:hypothetical protein
MAWTCINLVSCHHLAPDLAHLSDQSTTAGSPLSGLPSIFSRQLACQVGVCAWSHGEPDGTPSSLSVRSQAQPNLHRRIHHLGRQRQQRWRDCLAGAGQSCASRTDICASRSDLKISPGVTFLPNNSPIGATPAKETCPTRWSDLLHRSGRRKAHRVLVSSAA